MIARVFRWLVAGALVVAPALACGPAKETVGAQATKPQSPAEGAKDYDVSPGGTPTQVDATGQPPTNASSSAAPVALDCPPKCSGDDAWVGCGLKKPRGSKCKGCTPKCKKKGTVDEGWYDCSGVLIVQADCTDTATP